MYYRQFAYGTVEFCVPRKYKDLAKVITWRVRKGFNVQYNRSWSTLERYILQRMKCYAANGWKGTPVPNQDDAPGAWYLNYEVWLSTSTPVFYKSLHTTSQQLEPQLKFAQMLWNTRALSQESGTARCGLECAWARTKCCVWRWSRRPYCYRLHLSGWCYWWGTKSWGNPVLVDSAPPLQM